MAVEVPTNHSWERSLQIKASVGGFVGHRNGHGAEDHHEREQGNQVLLPVFPPTIVILSASRIK
jgi:hypothetical protein